MGSFFLKLMQKLTHELKRPKVLWVAAAVAVLALLLLNYFEPQSVVTREVAEETVDPMATDFFFMRNPEIREDLLEQLRNL